MDLGIKTDYKQRFLTFCKKNSLKATPQRMAIFIELFERRTHPSTEEIYRQLRIQYPSISYDTVNRTLTTFAQAGLIDAVEGLGGARRYDSEIKPHDHFYCVSCHRIIDFHIDDFDNITIPENIRDNFRIYSKKLILKGLCSNCNSNNNINGISAKEK